MLPDSPGNEPDSSLGPFHSDPSTSPTLSWLMIAIGVLCLTILPKYLSQPPPSASSVANEDVAGLVMFDAMIRYFVGAESITPGMFSKELDQLNSFRNEPAYARRLAALRVAALPLDATPDVVDDASPAVVAAAVAAAVDLLNPPPSDPPRAPSDAPELDALLTSIIRDGVEPTDAQRTLIHDKLGWIGDLFLTRHLPASDPARAAVLAPARRTVIALFSLFGVGLLAGVIGLALLIIGIVVRTSGGLRPRFTPPRLARPILIEAFAVYLLTIVAFQIVPLLFGASVEFADSLSLPGLAIGSILGVIWPILRGLPARAVFTDLGLHTGSGIWREIGCGIVGYLAMIPVFALILLATILCMFIVQQFSPLPPDEPQEIMSHPLVVYIAQGNWSVRLLMLFLASGFAPFFEETLFRGAMLRDLRRWMGPILALPLMAFIFAIIHPQGLLAVPALMSLAVGLGVLRLWRDSLVPGMIAHAIHNGALVAVMCLIL